MLNLLYISIIIPIQIGYGLDLFIPVEGFSLFISLVVILLNFRTPVIQKGGENLDFWVVTKNYA